MKQLGVFLLHPGQGTSQPQVYPQRNLATAGESRVYDGPEGNLISVANMSTLAYFSLSEKEVRDSLIYPVQNADMDRSAKI